MTTASRPTAAFRRRQEREPGLTREEVTVMAKDNMEIAIEYCVT
jgi:hypothetical protein